MRKKKKAFLWLILVLAAAAIVWLILPPRPVRIGSDIRVGEDVRIPAPGGSLAGSLLRPTSGATPTPAVVMITGSGSYSFRKSFQPEVPTLWKAAAEAFLEKGWMVLFLEKRGVNGSTGSWKRQSFAGRAGDAIAGVRYLRGRPEVDAKRVGLCGHSQGGWIVQLAAALYPDEIAFVVSLAGPNITVRQQIIDDRVNEWRCAGTDEDSIRKKEKRLRTRLGFYAGLSRVVKIGYLSRILDYDPAAVASRIRCPILALYGEHDTLVLPETNAALLKHGLEKAGNTVSKSVIVPQASHGFIRIPGKCPDWDKVDMVLAPEFRAELADWNPFSNPEPSSDSPKF